MAVSDSDYYVKRLALVRAHIIGVSFPSHALVLSEPHDGIITMATKLGVASSYNTKMHIDLLPEEFLNHIFVLTSTTHLCPLLVSYGSLFAPEYTNRSIALSHVSPRWRRITLNCKDLLTHIDLVLSRFTAKYLPPRTELVLTRAGEMSVNIHIISSELPIKLGNDTPIHLIEFLTSIAPRTRGVMWDSLDTSITNVFLCPEVISVFLNGCVPGRLTQFSVQSPTSHTFTGDDTLVKHLEPTVETLWHSVKVLKLRGFYPKWTSKLYHGLTELRLSAARWAVPESALVAILGSSPKLRVLEVGVYIAEARTRHAPITPVILSDLEVLRSTGPKSEEVLTLMSLVHPGQKSLTLEIVDLPQYITNMDFVGERISKDFFARSNVTRLIVSCLDNYLDLFHLLVIAPTVRTLALEYLEGPLVVEDEDLPSPPSTFTLEALYVTRTSNYPRTRQSAKTSKWFPVETIVRRHSVPQLTLWSYSFDRGAVPDNLYTICPQVTIVSDQDPDRTQEWIL